MPKTFYITTPIYYPSGKLQLGNTFTTVYADSLARFHRLIDEETYFLTGTDEHGLKIQQKAQASNQTEIEYLDQQISDIQKLWQLMDISYDQFIRTTDTNHQKLVQKIFSKLLEQGDIYKGEYIGWYSVSDEEYFTESQLLTIEKDDDGQTIGGTAPSGHPVELVKEEAYFFKMSKYADWLLDYYRQNPDFIQPSSRMNEMIKNFIEPGLEDLAVTRTSFDWGIKVPNDPKHVIYVWIDALSNYITALGFDADKNFEEQTDLFEKFWPANIQLVGKEIVRFHTIYWPIMLHALGLKMPKKIVGHGWLVMKDGKMSKSKGNVIYPEELVSRYGLDPVRYYLLRVLPFGQDGIFTPEDFVSRLNFDLANDLGNLLNRTVSMINQYCNGEIQEFKINQTKFDQELKQQADQTIKNFISQMTEAKTADALESVWELVRRTNKYVDETEPWVLNKNNQQAELENCLAHLVASLRVIAALSQPVLTQTTQRILEQIGIDNQIKIINLKFEDLPVKIKVIQNPEPIFPRVDADQEIGFISSLIKKDDKGKGRAAQAAKKEKKMTEENDKIIEFDDFAKVQMVAVKLLKGEIVENSEKLIKWTVDDGSSTNRQILSGIRQWYPDPEKLVGKMVIAVINLSPRKMAGELSQGMILAAENDQQDVILTFLPDQVQPGAIIG